MAIDIPFGQPVSVLSDDPGDSAERATQAQAALDGGRDRGGGLPRAAERHCVAVSRLVERLGGARRAGAGG